MGTTSASPKSTTSGTWDTASSADTTARSTTSPSLSWPESLTGTSTSPTCHPTPRSSAARTLEPSTELADTSSHQEMPNLESNLTWTLTSISTTRPNGPTASTKCEQPVK